jgi:hypothetical protein
MSFSLPYAKVGVLRVRNTRAQHSGANFAGPGSSYDGGPVKGIISAGPPSEEDPQHRAGVCPTRACPVLLYPRSICTPQPYWLPQTRCAHDRYTNRVLFGDKEPVNGPFWRFPGAKLFSQRRCSEGPPSTVREVPCGLQTAPNALSTPRSHGRTEWDHSASILGPPR